MGLARDTDQQISLTDPDARSMATSGRGSGIVGYNVQIAVEANHHLIVMHEVTNDGTDRSQLSHVANEAKTALGVEKLDAVADRGYFNSEEIHCRIMLITAIVRPFLAAAALVAPIRSCSSYRRKAAISNIGSRAPANHMSVSLKRVISIVPRDLQRCPITWSKQT